MVQRCEIKIILQEIHEELSNTNHPAGHGSYPCRFQNMTPVREEKEMVFIVFTNTYATQCCIRDRRHDLDVEFQVFIHGKDVVENVFGDARNDAHLVRVVQLALTREMAQRGLAVDSCGLIMPLNSHKKNICLVKAGQLKRLERKQNKDKQCQQ